jgi:hypothetical protein
MHNLVSFALTMKAPTCSTRRMKTAQQQGRKKKGQKIVILLSSEPKRQTNCHFNHSAKLNFKGTHRKPSA